MFTYLVVIPLVCSLLFLAGVVHAQDSFWTAQYFNNTTLSGTPVFTRAESAIIWNWQLNAPAPQITADNFSVRWTKTATLSAGNYQFTLSGDDGVRFYLDDTLIIDQWRDQVFSTYTIIVPVSVGSHTLRVEYYEHTNTAQVVFNYMPVAGSAGGSVSPTVQWRAEYFANNNLQGTPQVVRSEPGGALQRYWGDHPPVAGLPVDNFSVRWSRQLCTDGRSYLFTLMVDDSARMYIGDVLIINAWAGAVGQRLQQPVDLTLGCYMLTVEYREFTRNASIDLTWYSPEGVVLPSLGGVSLSPVPISGLPAIVTTGRLNMREGPGVDYNIVSSLYRSQEIAVVALDKAIGWAQVKRADGVTGWVNADFIQYTVDSFIASPIQGKLTAGLNLRDGPGTVYRVLDTLTWGTIVDVIGRTADGTWLQVQINNQTGWVFASFVREASGSFDEAPVTR